MVEVGLPRLADRKEDLPLLEHHFVARVASQYRKDIRGLTGRVQIRFAQHSWPGNVRELENVIGHAATMTMSDSIDIQDLPLYLQSGDGHVEPSIISAPPVDIVSFDEQERVLLTEALESAGGNQSQAARILRIGRDAFRHKLKKYNLA